VYRQGRGGCGSQSGQEGLGDGEEGLVAHARDEFVIVHDVTHLEYIDDKKRSLNTQHF
jgi:hypothetical protein